MRHPISLLLCLGLAAALGGCGLVHPSSKDQPIRYSADGETMSLRSVSPGGDFALYFDDSERAEVPVRVNDGDSVGFVRMPDGRVEAVAGPFRMHIKPSIQSATWNRLTKTEE